MADTSGTVRITTVLVETNPFVESVGDGPALAPEYADLDPQWLPALGELLVHVDTATCWRCDEPVGFTLYGDNDRFAEWVATGLAREGGGPVAVLCEDCTPYVPTAPLRGASVSVAVVRPEQPQVSPSPVVDGTYELPPHLRVDALFAVCGRCQRKTWALSEFGQECQMPQPDGKPCEGRFSNPEVQP